MIETFVLVLWLTAYGGGAAISVIQGYQSREACETAIAQMGKRGPSAMCISGPRKEPAK